jgi:hypothetical protein
VLQGDEPPSQYQPQPKTLVPDSYGSHHWSWSLRATGPTSSQPGVTTPGCVYPHTLRAESPRYGHRVRREFTPLYPSSIDTRARTSGRFATGECEQPDLGCARGNPVGNPVEECHRSSSEITAATRSARNWLPDGVKCTFLGCCSLLSSGSHCENKSWTRTPWLCIKDIAAAL